MSIDMSWNQISWCVLALLFVRNCSIYFGHPFAKSTPALRAMTWLACFSLTGWFIALI